MFYGITKYKYGPSELMLKYKDDELNSLLEKFMNENEEFSFSQLCKYILSMAEQQDMLGKEPNTSYSQVLLTHADTIKICKMLWKYIWEKKLIHLFNNPHDVYHNNGETYFVVVK